MGQKERSSSSRGLGRALVRHHNQMVQQSKEKGVALRRRGKAPILESVTEVSDIDAIIEMVAVVEEQATTIEWDDDVIGTVGGGGGGGSSSLSLPKINLDMNSSASEVTTMTPEERRKQQKREEALYASNLRVPRRPPWTAKMSLEELNVSERQAFLAWRRNLARLEENETLVLTPFEKNLDIWRQLWRVLERSDLLVMVVDARDPLFYRCPDLEAYAREIDEHKKTLLLVNKADLLPVTVRQRWASYFRLQGILSVFWSAKTASATLEGKRLSSPWGEQNIQSDADFKIYDRDELLARLQTEAEAIVSRRASCKKGAKETSFVDLDVGNPAPKHVVVGFVGYPNVGKSSTINALVGEKRTGVTSTPGKTKHFQTLIISDELILCDCPGLVFPSFSSSRYEMIASGVLPIDRMTEHREAVRVVANSVPRHTMESIYHITLPKPKPYEPQLRPPLASELLRAYCSSRGHVGSSGLPDETRAARQILKDYIDGRLPHFELPPGTTTGEDGDVDLSDMSVRRSSSSAIYYDESDSCDPIDRTSTRTAAADYPGEPDLGHVLSELESFDNGLHGAASTSVAAAVGKKASAAADHKHHKKPQRRKDRSWRVGNDDEDGMPVVRVIQKPAVNFGSFEGTSLTAFSRGD